MNGESVRHFHPSQHHLLHPDRPPAPGQDPFPRLLMRPLLQRMETKRRDVEKTAGRKVKSTIDFELKGPAELTYGREKEELTANI